MFLRYLELERNDSLFQKLLYEQCRFKISNYSSYSFLCVGFCRIGKKNVFTLARRAIIGDYRTLVVEIKRGKV
ncbi:hypothetical protein BWD12_08370 [Leptospira santarosai serovar Bananal]|uniref:Uncharacterized protein n=1 Tax=Leptospira santarosai TaxID=28183 RepID=A0AB73NAS7_9LEPT|nr:hypothetical protein BWD11_18725 [Leptospira santarosai serovar Grippotyphosa]ONF79695.1 hypothetical protein BWD12_08370 [Leptospira santarosai serovar Bananal]ONF94716.1 hypothetical protein BWD14_01415 [Leptospira santarosai]